MAAVGGRIFSTRSLYVSIPAFTLTIADLLSVSATIFGLAPHRLRISAAEELTHSKTRRWGASP